LSPSSAALCLNRVAVVFFVSARVSGLLAQMRALSMREEIDQRGDRRCKSRRVNMARCGRDQIEARF
jgi:hypothetical protein